MALLNVADKNTIFKELEDELSSDNFPVSFGRPDGRLSVDNVDQWIEDNFASFNNSLPALVKADLSTKWKIGLLDKIIKCRWEVE